MDFEEILEEVGSFGKFQKRLTFFFMMVATILVPMYCMTTIFMVSSPSHWCKVEELSNLSFDQQIQLISPSRVENGISKPDSCHMYDIDYSYMARVANLSVYMSNQNLTELPVKTCDNGWAYDNSYYDETAVTALDLVCDRSHYVSLLLSVGSFGTIIATPILGLISDKLGRKRAFQITLFIFIISSLSPTIFRDLKSFIIFRTINGFITPSFYQMPFIIMIESVGPRSRTLLNSMACVGWVLGCCLLSLVAFMTRNWITFNVITSLTIVTFFITWKMVPESPRWYLSNDRYEDAEELLLKIAKINGKPRPENLLVKLKAVGKKMANEQLEIAENALFVIFKNPGLRKNFLLVTFNWMTCAAIYWGITMNLYNFSGNEFLNFFLLSIIELPAYLVGWYAIETRFGRRLTNALSLFLCGLCLCIPALIPKSYWVVTNAMTILGKFCGSITFMVIYQQAAELYPTSIRNQGLGIGAMASSLVGIVMPYLTFWVSEVWIPLVILGLASIAIGLISTLIPETLNVILPQSIAEGNIFGKNQKYFSWANTKSISKIEDNGNEKGMDMKKQNIKY